MLSELEVGQFHAFGFTVIRNCLSADECEQVEKAYTRLIPSAPRYNYFSEIGTRRTVRFVFEDANLGSLIEHPKVMEVMRGNLLNELESPMSRQRWPRVCVHSNC